MPSADACRDSNELRRPTRAPTRRPWLVRYHPYTPTVVRGANNAQQGAPARLSRAAAGARGSCSHARCRRLCSCSLLNSQSVFFSIRPLLCPFLCFSAASSRSCPPFIGLQAWTQLRIRAASGRGRVSEACGASASHRARCRKGRHRACRRQTEIWRVFIWPDRELPSRSVTLTQ